MKNGNNRGTWGQEAEVKEANRNYLDFLLNFPIKLNLL